MRCLSFGFVAIAITSGIALCAGVTIIRPQADPQAILHNPEMGWVLYENYPVDPRPGGSSTMVTLPDERFPDVGHVAIMFSWADVERREGEYEFSAVDRAYDHWKRLGKQIQLRMSTESLLWWNTLDPPRGIGVPPYLLEKLSPAAKQQRTLEGTPYAVVDARQPIYLERLERFLAAVANHFGSRRPVTYIDLRGFGVWGEWHSGFRYESPDARRDALTGVIDRYCAAFPDHPVALSYSHDPDGPPEYFAGPTDRYDASATESYHDFVRYSAFDHALTKPNIAFRRDGCGCAIYSNQRKFCEAVFATLKTGPMMSEFCGGYEANKKGGDKWLNFVIGDALSLHPNYINLLGWQAGDALAFTKERPDLVARGLRSMGYRLVPTAIRFPSTIPSGKAFELAMHWENHGVGRAPRDLHLVLLLGEAKIDAGTVPASRWISGKTYEVVNNVMIDLPPGEYEARFHLEDRKYDQRIALPLRPKKDRTYPLGPMRVTSNR
jgi:hypothetical protein